MMLHNLPSHLKSRLKHVHLVRWFHTEDVKTCGCDAILRPIVRDLTILETDGVRLMNRMTGMVECVKGALILISSENLGAHCFFLGFNDSQIDI